MDFKSRLSESLVTKVSCFVSKFSFGQKKSSGRRRASTLVETALCMTFVLIPMTIAGIQFAIVINASHTLNRMAREGARFAAVHGGESTFDNAVNQSNPPSLKNYMQTLCSGTNIAYSDIQNKISVTSAANRKSGLGITVSISYPMSKKIIFNASSLTDRLGFKNLSKDYVATATFILE
jgi:Flp pilus assembly protein TadG